MSFFDYLDNLRAKPERTKTKIALSISLVLTSVVFLFWAMSFWGGSSKTETLAENAESPLTSIGSSFANAFIGIRDQFSSAKERLDKIFGEVYVPSPAPENTTFDSAETPYSEY